MSDNEELNKNSENNESDENIDKSDKIVGYILFFLVLLGIACWIYNVLLNHFTI